MFGKRPDGKLVRTHDGIYTLMPHVMNKRDDSMNMVEFDVDMDDLDQFIKKAQEETGIVYSYLEILVSAVVRTIYLRPDLNRFVVNRRIYQRDGIYFSMVVQKSLKKGYESNETGLKFRFEGNESLDYVHEVVDKGIRESKNNDRDNDIDDFSKKLASMPFFLMSMLVHMIKFLDRYGLLPKKVIDIMPFHTTFFITNMRSVKTPAIYHHVYNFGTTGLFLSTGTEKLEPQKDKDDNVTFKRVMPVKFVSDERFCDGYYFATSLRMLQRILHNPKVLLTPLPRPERELTKKELKEKKKTEKKI
ncbi:MAG: hypothetical protein H6687_03410, partial [Bacillales bacterium]|nr:hypothetical protein [Bacillales bacterium]